MPTTARFNTHASPFSARDTPNTSFADTREFQSVLQRHQHPPVCDPGRMVAMRRGPRSGGPAEQRMRALFVLMAFAQGHVAVEPGASCSAYCCLEPLSNCSMLSNTPTLDAPAVRSAAEDAPTFPRPGAGQLRDFRELLAGLPQRFGGRHADDPYWWTAQAIRYVVRPDAACRRDVVRPAALRVLPGPRSTGKLVSVFVMGGHIDAHFKALPARDAAVYLDSDAADSVDAAVAAYGGRLCLAYLDSLQRRRGGAPRAGGPEDTSVVQWMLCSLGHTVVGDFTTDTLRVCAQLRDTAGRAGGEVVHVGEVPTRGAQKAVRGTAVLLALLILAAVRRARSRRQHTDEPAAQARRHAHSTADQVDDSTAARIADKHH